MPAGKDLTGATYGRLKVLRQLPNEGKHRMWLVRCECGSERAVKASALSSGDTKSCGCLRRDTLAAMARVTSRKHGYCSGAVPRWYSIWSGMMKRCYNPRAIGFANYGGRGIKVCKRWHDPGNFLADMGEPPTGMSIDRINGNGDYRPGNCRWATDIQQANNRRTIRWIEYNGIRDHMSGWAKRLGVCYATLQERLEKWPIDRALSLPKQRP